MHRKLGRFVDSLSVTKFTPPSPSIHCIQVCRFFASLQIERVFRRNLFLYLISDFVCFFSRLPFSVVQFFRYRCSTIKWTARKGLCCCAYLFPFFFSASALFYVFIPKWWDFYQQTNANEKLIYFCMFIDLIDSRPNIAAGKIPTKRNKRGSERLWKRSM